MNIAIYARVSTERQAEQGMSIDDQINQITKWAEENKHSIIEVYSELGASAFEGSRPVFQKMVDDALSLDHPFDAIVVHSQSRFFRNNYERAFYEQLLEKNDVQVRSITQPLPEDENTANLVKNVVGIIDEYQSRENSKHVIRCLRANAEQGFFNGSKPPYGYQSIKTDIPSRTGYKKRLAIDVQEAEVVKLIFKLSLQGEDGISWGVKKIAEFLNRNGYTRRGNVWQKQKVHSILTSNTYIGEYETFKVDTNKKKLRPKQDWVITKIPAIIDREEFDQVQKGLSARNFEKSEARSETSPSLLTGLLKCKSCNKNLTVMTGKSGKYKYYRCATKSSSSVNLCECPNIPKEKLEQIILGRIKEEVLSADRILSSLSTLRASLAKSTESEGKRILTLQSDVARQRERVNILYEQIGDRKLDLDSTLIDHIESQQKRILSLNREIEVLKKRQTLPIKNFGERHVNAFIEAAEEGIFSPDSPHAKAYLRAIISEIRVTRSDVTVRGDDFDLVSVVSRWKRGAPITGVPRHFTEWRPRHDSNV